MDDLGRLLFLFFLLSFNNAGASTSASVDLKNTFKDPSISKKTEDLDAEVRDIKLRADSGKKSKYSTSLTFTYKGGTVENPSIEYRPPLGDETRPEETGVSGNFSLRYRINKNKSLFFATGFNQRRPFHELSREEKKRGEDKDLELFSPQLGFNNTFAIKDWELSSSFRSYYNTLDFRKQIGEVSGVIYSLSTLKNWGDTKFKGGLIFSAAYVYFNKDMAAIKGKMRDVRPLQIDYKVSLLPSLQFNFSDKLNFYTSFTVANFVHRRSIKAAFDFEQTAMNQTLGLGYSIFRDFYVSPYLNFEPGNIAADKVLLNLKTTINF